MKLRNFLYLNTMILDEYLSVINGCVYDSETLSTTVDKKTGLGLKVGVQSVGVDGVCTKQKQEEIIRSATISDASKFEQLYRYLNNTDEEDSIKYYEFINPEIFDGLNKDDFLEVLVTARFSKIKEITDSAQKLAELSEVLGEITGSEILDQNSANAINGFSSLSKLRNDKDISCVFEFDDNQCPLVSTLDKLYFKCDQERFVGQAYLLCKVLRKIPKGKSIQIDDLFNDIKFLPANREQRRKMQKKLNKPNSINDVIKGPALVVLPIAFYQ